MANDQINGFIRKNTFSFMAGVIGGTSAGIIEVLFISGFGNQPANLSSLSFSVIAYGLLGGAFGKALHLMLMLVPIHQDRKNSRRQLGHLSLPAHSALSFSSFSSSVHSEITMLRKFATLNRPGYLR